VRFLSVRGRRVPGGTDNPISESSNSGIFRSIIIHDEFVATGVPFRCRDRTHEAASCDIALDEWHRRQRHAKSFYGSLELKIHVLKLQLTEALEIRRACFGEPMRPGRARRSGVQDRMMAQIMPGLHRAFAQKLRAARRTAPICHQRF